MTKKQSAKSCSSKKSCAKKGSTSKAASMKITSRIVDVRRHTKGYIAGGKNYTVPQMRKLAASGCVRGVQVVGRHIQAKPGSRRLTDLPMKVVK